jgi:hypothetical protein
LLFWSQRPEDAYRYHKKNARAMQITTNTGTNQPLTSPDPRRLFRISLTRGMLSSEDVDEESDMLFVFWLVFQFICFQYKYFSSLLLYGVVSEKYF